MFQLKNIKICREKILAFDDIYYYVENKSKLYYNCKEYNITLRNDNIIFTTIDSINIIDLKNSYLYYFINKNVDYTNIKILNINDDEITFCLPNFDITTTYIFNIGKIYNFKLFDIDYNVLFVNSRYKKRDIDENNYYNIYAFYYASEKCLRLYSQTNNFLITRLNKY